MQTRGFSAGQVGHLRNPGALNGAVYPERLTRYLDARACEQARDVISGWSGYAPTPLHDLAGLAAHFGIGALYYKDESERFGLGSFKALGGAHAVLRLLQRELGITSEVAAATAPGGAAAAAGVGVSERIAGAEELTVVTATAGNHGRSVAWGAERFGCRCLIYMHAGVSEARAEAVRAFGAEVVRVDGDYDESVRRAALDARANGWFVVSDTSYEGYEEVPRQVMAGYSVLASEALEQLSGVGVPTHVLLQGGVGGLAAAVLARMWLTLDEERPRFVVIEPERAACLLQSVRRGEPTAVTITQETLMGGLSCGEVSRLAWPILAAGAEDFLTLPDSVVAPAMRLLADGAFGDAPIVAGESAVPGICVLLAAHDDPALREALELSSSSRVLVIGSEGATDAAMYRSLVGRSVEQVLNTPPNSTGSSAG